jgi:septum formation topological specificity factor MinE
MSVGRLFCEWKGAVLKNLCQYVDQEKDEIRFVQYRNDKFNTIRLKFRTRNQSMEI